MSLPRVSLVVCQNGVNAHGLLRCWICSVTPAFSRSTGAPRQVVALWRCRLLRLLLTYELCRWRQHGNGNGGARAEKGPVLEEGLGSASHPTTGFCVLPPPCGDCLCGPSLPWLGRASGAVTVIRVLLHALSLSEECEAERATKCSVCDANVACLVAFSFTLPGSNTTTSEHYSWHAL